MHGDPSRGNALHPPAERGIDSLRLLLLPNDRGEQGYLARFVKLAGNLDQVCVGGCHVWVEVQGPQELAAR